MKIIFYAKGNNGASKRLQQIVEPLIPKGTLELHKGFESLYRRLHQPHFDLKIALLFAGSEIDLFEILSVRDLLENIPIILILPDDGKQTVSRGFSLYPRYISYANSDFKDVAAVLEKMLKVNEIKGGLKVVNQY